MLVDTVDFKEWDDHIWREGCFGALESLCHVADLGDDCFVRGLFGTWFGGDLVDLVKKRLPSCSDISIVAVVGDLVDLEADVVVVSGIGISIVQLLLVSKLQQFVRSTYPSNIQDRTIEFLNKLGLGIGIATSFCLHAMKELLLNVSHIEKLSDLV